MTTDVLSTSALNPSLSEFAGLWKYISDWQGVFRHFDRDGSGTIDGDELANAFANFGHNLAPETLAQIQEKYGACSHRDDVVDILLLRILVLVLDLGTE